MASWIYVFSKFTPEVLLFEILIILFLCCGYLAFWILRKRRYGSVDSSVPSGPVKAYLNELIVSSEQLRLQLFGLLAGSNPSSTGLYKLVGVADTPSPTIPAIGDPDFAKKLAALEGRLQDQLKMIENLTLEKSQLERELEAARSKPGSSQDPTSPTPSPTTEKEDVGTIVRLQQKLLELEGKLAEYNVIEDDLANLKRLQQENNQLKSLLTSKGMAMPGGIAEPSSLAATASPHATTDAGAVAASASTSTSTSAATDPPAPNPSQATPGAQNPAAGNPGTNPAQKPAAGSPEETAHAEKPQDDLVSELEKTLKT